MAPDHDSGDNVSLSSWHLPWSEHSPFELSFPAPARKLDDWRTSKLPLEDDDCMNPRLSTIRPSSTDCNEVRDGLRWSGSAVVIEKEDANVEGSSPPDGGVRAWLQVLGCFMLFWNTWGLINASAAFQTYYELYLLRQLESTTIAWIGSIQSWLLLCVGVVSGPLFDAGYGRQLLCAGSCLVPFGFMMTSVARNFWQLLLGQAFCIGIGGGLLFIPSIAIIPQYFTSRRRALAIGIAGLGSATSGTLVPLLFRELSAVVGFRWTARVLGFISLGTLAIALSVLRVKTLPSKRRSLTQFSAFRELPFIVLTLSNLITFTGCYAAVFYVQPFSVDRGITSAGLAFYLVPVLNAATIVGRIVLTFSADNLGPVNVLVIAQLINSIIAYSWIAVDSPAGVFTVASLYGFFMGGVVNLPFVTLVAVCPDLSDIGTRMGMCFFVASFGLLAGTPLAGKIQTEGSYRSLQVFAGSLLLAAALFTGILRVMKAGWTLKAKV